MTLDQGAHSFIQLGPENLQGWRQPNLSGQPTPLPASPQREKCVFISSLDLSSFSWCCCLTLLWGETAMKSLSQCHWFFLSRYCDAVRCSKAISTPCWTIPSPIASPCRTVLEPRYLSSICWSPSVCWHLSHQPLIIPVESSPVPCWHRCWGRAACCSSSDCMGYLLAPFSNTFYIYVQMFG